MEQLGASRSPVSGLPKDLKNVGKAGSSDFMGFPETEFLATKIKFGDQFTMQTVATLLL
jgi:hypothetical protein